MKQSSGTLLYRHGPDGLEVLIVHPSGAYNRRAAWGIPKGVIDAGETPEQAARRETWEETGVAVSGELLDLGFIDYTRSKKRVYCFAGPAPADCAPRCASWEVDQACFVPIGRARQLIHHDQATFLDRLQERLAREGGSG